MNKLIEKVFEAHVEHELKLFKNSGYKHTIENEITALFNWTEQVKLKDIVTPEQVIGFIERNVVESPIAAGITELAGEMSRKVLDSENNKNTLLEDIFARKQFDEIVDKSVTLENVRKDLIKRFLNSTVYSKLISNVLFVSIKEYLVTENVIAKKMPKVSTAVEMGKNAVSFAEKMPGVSSLIKIGKEITDYAIPSLEADLEHRVKKFIENNIHNKIKHSEKILIEIFNEKRILAIGDHVWNSIAKTPLSEFYSTIDDNDMEDFIIIGYEFWLHFRKTKYFKEIYQELVLYFFEKYGDNELDLLIEDVGISKQQIINEAIHLVSPGIETALKTGYVEERIRARLKLFYGARKTASLFKSLKNG